MAKIKYDVSGVEPSRDFETPIPVGVYGLLIVNAVKRKNRAGTDDLLELELEVPKGDHKGRKVWEYITLNSSSEWKLRQLIDALGAKLKGTLDTDKLIGQTLLTKVKHEPWEKENEEGETEIVVTSKVASFLKPKDETEEEESEEEEEEAEESEEEEAEEEESDDLTWADLEGYDRDELKQFIKENESSVKVTKGKPDQKIREEIAAEYEIEVPEAEESEEEEAEEDGTDYDSWSMPDLKKELKSRDLKVTGTKKALVKRLEKDDSKSTGKKKDEPF